MGSIFFGGCLCLYLYHLRIWSACWIPVGRMKQHSGLLLLWSYNGLYHLLSILIRAVPCSPAPEDSTDLGTDVPPVCISYRVLSGGAGCTKIVERATTKKNGCNNCFELPLLFLRRIYIDLDCYVAGFLRGKVVRMTIRIPFRVYTKYACTGFYYIGMCQEQLGENLLPNHLRRQGRQ